MKIPYLLLITLTLVTESSLVGCSSPSDDDNQPQGVNTSLDPPSAPSEVMAIVYSSSAVELSWSSAKDNGTIVGYQIYRDGILIATQSSLRFYENALSSGTTYTYQILAIDEDGNFSEPEEIVAITLSDGPSVSNANFSVILPFVFDIANERLINNILQAVNDTDASWLSGADVNKIPGLTLVDQAVDATERWTIYTYDCELGGTFNYHKDVFIQFGGHFKGYYDECHIGPNIISGDINRKATVNKAPPYNEILTSQYNVTVQNDELGNSQNFTGQVSVDNSQVDNMLSATNASYYDHNLLWSTMVSDFEISIYATDVEPLANYAKPFSRSFSGHFKVKGPQTSDDLLTVNFTFSTDSATSLNYQSGYLEVIAEDGSNMIMDLTNADQETFQLSFSHASNSSASIVTWTDDYRLLCLHKPTFKFRLNVCE